MRVLDYGATVQALLVPDRQARVEDVVLGFVCDEDYTGNFLDGRLSGKGRRARAISSFVYCRVSYDKRTVSR